MCSWSSQDPLPYASTVFVSPSFESQTTPQSLQHPARKVACQACLIPWWQQFFQMHVDFNFNLFKNAIAKIPTEKQPAWKVNKDIWKCLMLPHLALDFTIYVCKCLPFEGLSRIHVQSFQIKLLISPYLTFPPPQYIESFGPQARWLPFTQQVSCS